MDATNEARSTPLRPPYAPLPPLGAALRAAIEAEALRANDRYLAELIEGHSFCPFARGGRLAGETHRHVHFAGEDGAESLLALMARVAADPRQVVAQVILPLVDVAPADFIRFCDELTAAGHARMGGPPVLAFAALHPELPYSARNAYAMVPLFRRAPDPTIQWVRLDGIAAVYEGRGTEARFVDPDQVLAFVRDEPPPRQALYDRVAETNAKVAHELGLARVEAMLADIAADARRSYARLLREHGAASRV
jgi:hypothetical protein